MKENSYLPPEWHEQSVIQLTWPHENTDWAYMLPEVEICFFNLARQISMRQPLLVVTPTPDELHSKFISQDINTENVFFWKCQTNDTWARDHAFITMLSKDGTPLLHDFCFNAWGLKFASNYDNQINRSLMKSGMMKGCYINKKDFVLEGGSIESDGKGTLLTTAPCLLSPNRNDTLDECMIENYLKKTFGLKRVLWLRHGFLSGDDTDSHVDTLARFCSADTIVYVSCDDQDDEHYEELYLMKEELHSFRTLDGNPYRLLPLPMPRAIYDEDGCRLPATYANFLIMNHAVLYPTYQQPDNDEKAKDILQQAFPDYAIVGIDCTPLIKQHGSLHCVTMQYPVGVWKYDYLLNIK